MKRTPIFASLVFLLFATVTLSAEDGATDRTIAVSGTAERSVPADRIEIQVQIRSVRNTLAEAQEASEAVFGRLAKRLAELGLEEEAVALRDHRLGRDYRRGPNGEQIPRGFYSQRDLEISLEDVAILEAIYTELANDEDLQVNGSDFSRKDEIEIRKELREEALKAARQKATEMAAVFEQFIGKPLKIEEGGTSFGPNQFSTRNTMAFEGGSSAQGRVNLSASVSVVFELTE